MTYAKNQTKLGIDRTLRIRNHGIEILTFTLEYPVEENVILSCAVSTI